jgi:hypothetical protein
MSMSIASSIRAIGPERVILLLAILIELLSLLLAYLLQAHFSTYYISQFSANIFVYINRFDYSKLVFFNILVCIKDLVS